IVVDGLLADRVEGRGRLVQHEDRGVADKGARDFDALPLPSAEIRAAFVHVTIVVPRPRREILMDKRVAGRGNQLLLADRSVPEREIVPRTSLEQKNILIDVRDGVCKNLRRNVRQSSSVEQNFTGPRLVETADQLAEGRLSASTPANQSHSRSRWNDEGEIAQERRLQCRIAEADMSELDPARKLRREFTGRGVAACQRRKRIFVNVLEPFERPLDGLQ